MESLVWFSLTIIIALISGIVVMRFKVPAGGMIGGMIGVAVFNLIFGKAYIYPYVRIGVQICLGAMSGSRVSIKELKEMRKLVGSIICMFVVLMAINIIFGVIIIQTTGLDASTALLSITAGGATDMVFFAEDIGADTGMVGLLQSLRMLYCNGILPIIFVELLRRKQDMTELRTECIKEQPMFSYQKLTGMFIAAVIGGLLFRSLGIAGGTLVGAMIFTVVYTCVIGKTVYPNKLKRYQQILTGAYIGVSITRDTVSMIPSMAVAMVIIIIDIMLYVFLMSAIFSKTSKLDYGTCLLCSTPGGVGEVSILSEEMGMNTAVVATVNTVRMILVVSTFPAILSVVARLLS